MKIQFPGFKILDRYILRRFLSTFFFVVAMLILVLVVFDYAEKIDDFAKNGAPFNEVVFDYYLNFIPSFINQFSGLVAFVAVIFFTSKMAYQTEIIAMLSGGMSFKRLMWPYFLGAFVIATLSLALNLWVIPISQKTSVEFDRKYIHTMNSGDYDRNIYRQIEPGVFVYLRGYSGSGRASFFAMERFEDGVMVESLEASTVELDAETNRWKAPRYTKRQFNVDDMGEVFSQHRNLDTLINLDRAELSRITDLLTTMQIGELTDFLDQQKQKGADSIIEIEVALHSRFAYPVGTFILSLIGVSLSSRKVRGGTGLHIGIGVALCFSYILFIRFAEEFAKGGALPPEVAVWMPNIIYIVIGIYCYNKAPK